MKLTTKEVEALAYEFQDEAEEVVEPPPPHHKVYADGWKPKLNPIQATAVASKAIFKLVAGPRMSGKTYGELHEFLDYLYRNDNSLGYIIVKEIGMGLEGGAWEKLRLQVIPEWEQGLGIECVWGTDFQTKSPYVWISNRHGGWSKAIVKSLPVAAQVEGKIRGREPDIIFVDEAQALASRLYFTNLLMQLGRKSAAEPSKMILCCNPEGPSHWLYQLFFIDPLDKDTGLWDERYAHFHIPVSDNISNLPPRYYEDYVLPAVRNDPILKARLVDGEWVDRPAGDSLFEGFFVEDIHTRGDSLRGIGLLPVVGVPAIISWDPGAVNTCVYFEQIVVTVNQKFKLVFDEFDWVGEYTTFSKVVKRVIDRQLYWEKELSCQFSWIHVSDNSAFNQFRPNTGSYDVKDIEKESRKYVEENEIEERFIIKMKEAPKGELSREARVRLLTESMSEQSFLMSATCKHGKDMFNRLPHDPENRMAPKKKHRYGHNLDAMTYGFFFFETRRTMPGTSGKITPQVYELKA